MEEVVLEIVCEAVPGHLDADLDIPPPNIGPIGSLSIIETVTKSEEYSTLQLPYRLLVAGGVRGRPSDCLGCPEPLSSPIWYPVDG